MARLIGEKPVTPGEMYIYRFAMDKLPDYIYVFFGAPVDAEAGKWESDALFIVPHMGIFAMQVSSASGIAGAKDGEILLAYRGGRARPWNPQIPGHYYAAVREYVKRKFGVFPFVYSLQCLPFVKADGENREILSVTGASERVFLAEDFEDGDRFLLRLQQCACGQKARLEKTLEGKVFFSDVTDLLAHNMFRFWKTGMVRPERPQRPPMVFLSHNRNNAAVAEEIRQELEMREIFTWMAEEDVGLGEFYKDVEMEAIAECDAFLILLSTPAQESREVRIEFERARELGKKILPVWVEDCEPNEYYREALKTYQYRVMTEPDAAVMEEIARCVTGKDSAARE